MNIAFGYCQCGCGKKTKINKYDHKCKGWIKGQPRSFLQHHYQRYASGSRSPHWKGGYSINDRGYVRILLKKHPRADITGRVYEHTLIAEAVLGKSLPLNTVVHHIDGNATNNKNDNLVICNDGGYHHNLHRRQKALMVSGHADWRRCVYCQQYDDVKNMYVARTCAYHRRCRQNARRRKNVFKPDANNVNSNTPRL